MESVQALLERGAAMDLQVAAALGREQEARRLLASAGPEERQTALSLAAQSGHAGIVRMLLEAGEDPNRFNPVGGHSHCTPLHQAAGFGHVEVVRALTENGARLDIKDILWNATPAEWAQHGGRSEIEEYLRGKER